uniref:Uncharacterized protein n=1 Tax=Geladintestivirus 2 TaxID=3233134 RepID=A0AAU8MKZ9_9CAUD
MTYMYYNLSVSVITWNRTILLIITIIPTI